MGKQISMHQILANHGFSMHQILANHGFAPWRLYDSFDEGMRDFYRKEDGLPDLNKIYMPLHSSIVPEAQICFTAPIDGKWVFYITERANSPKTRAFIEHCLQAVQERDDLRENLESE